jgi:KaiC/GvpD/RAD55 family RecA-like ATPase
MKKHDEKVIWTTEDLLAVKESADDTIVHGLFKKKEVQLFVATAKSGKSLLALNLAINLARADKFLNQFSTRKCRVFYLQTEIAPIELQGRFKAMIGDLDDDLRDNLFFSFIRLRIDTLEGSQKLKAMIFETKPDFLILDPLYTLHGSDENSASEMSRVLNDLKQIVTDSNLACLLIHHQGKAGESTNKSQAGFHARGSSALADVPDGTWVLVKDRKTHIGTLQFELRNALSPENLSLILGEDLWWRTMEVKGINIKADDSVTLIAKIICDRGIAGNRELVDDFCKKTGKSEKTAQTRIDQAYRQGLIHKTKKGQRVTWSIPSPKGNP